MRIPEKTVKYEKSDAINGLSKWKEVYFQIAYDIPIWITSVSLPSNQCGFMSSRTASISVQNCNNLLPFVCERGLFLLARIH
jgi:hypothetical protein